MITDRLASRLLAASWNVYYAGGEPDRPAGLDGRLASIGYSGPPAYAYGGTSYEWLGPLRVLMPAAFTPFPKRDAVTIGRTPTEIIVAFRGTIPPESTDQTHVKVDWFNNLLARLEPRAHMPGLLHAGFARSTYGLWSKLRAALWPMLSAYPELPVCFTGHSKGGAMAAIAAVRFNVEMRGRQTLVCTFGSARPGDTTFAAGLEAAVTESRRYEYGHDGVPHLPINSLPPHYAPAGRLFYLTKLPSPESTPSEVRHEGLGDDFVRSLALRMGSEGPRGGFIPGEDHKIAPSSGYDRWIHRA